MSNSSTVETALGAKYLIFLQFGSRIVTFTLNQLLIRYMSPELLGASAQLELYAISVIYFARESIRIALQRYSSQKGTSQVVVNMAYLAVVLGIPLSVGLGAIYLRACPEDVPYLHESLYAYGVAVVLELASEPAFAVAQYGRQPWIRAQAETLATMLRCIVTFSVAVWASQKQVVVGVLPFAFGQLSYAVALLLVYTLRAQMYARQKDFSLSLKPLQTKDKSQFIYSYFSVELGHLTLNLSLQSTVKYILTQGDSILITSLATLHDQGAYALASNYGSLVARMLFQPIEETSRGLFSKLNQSTSPNEKNPKTGIAKAKEVFQDILKVYILFSLVAVTVGPTLAPNLLYLVAGSKWADTGAVEVLSTYCYYIPLLAVNGVTEAFVSAVASTKELRTQSVIMSMCFAGFAATAYVLLHVLDLAATGLVFANCFNMILRIMWSVSFVRNFFAKKGQELDLLSTLPSNTTIAVTAAIPHLLRTTKGYLSQYGFLGELISSGSVAGLYGLTLLYLEWGHLKKCRYLL